jgi:RNA recognition motif-containing protein
MSDQNLTEEIINSESVTENETIESQDQNSLVDQELSGNETNNGIEEDLDDKNQEENNIEGEEMKKNVEEKIKKEYSKIEEESEITEEKVIDEINDKEDNKINSKENKEENKSNDNNEEEKVENKDDKIEEKEDKIKDDTKDKEKSKSEDLTKVEGESDTPKNIDNKKSDKDDNNASNKKGGSYSNNYRDKNYNGRFIPRGHQYNHHPYDDWGRRRGMNYPPYYEKDRRYGMRDDFRGRDFREFYDMRMERDYRGGFRDRDRDFDYPKFYGRGRDQRFFKRDRDFKYKRDYYDDYNMRNMDKDMRMNNMIRECRVYVQNLSYEVNSEMLKRFMEKVGKVVSVEILTSPDGRSKGCAVVQFETPNEARRAITDLQDNQFQGRPIYIREDREGMQYNTPMMDKSYMNDKQIGYQNEGGPSNYKNNINNTPKEQRIFVGNLDVNVTAKDLRTLFEPAGIINYADVFQKDRNQTSKHGIIGFQDPSSIKKAIEMFNGITYRNRKLDVHEDRRGIVPIRRFNTFKSDKNITIHNAGHHPYQPNSKPYPSGRGGKSNGPFPGKFNNNRQPPPQHQSIQNSQSQKMQKPPLPPRPSNSNIQDKPNGNTYGKSQSYNPQQNNSVIYPTPQQSVQPNSQVAMQYSQSTTQAPYMQPLAVTYEQPSQSTYAQPQGVQQTALYAGYPMTDHSATNSSVAAYQSSYQTAAYYSSLSQQAQPAGLPVTQSMQQPYTVATNVDYNNLYSAYYGQASQVGASGYPMLTQNTTTTTQGQTGYAEGSTLPTTYYY